MYREMAMRKFELISSIASIDAMMLRQNDLSFDDINDMIKDLEIMSETIECLENILNEMSEGEL